MKVSLDTMKSWFKKGLYPTESQFASVFDSFWHKDDAIPMASVQNLTQTLNNKASAFHKHELSDIYDLSVFEQDISNQLKTKANTEHEHPQYLTEHQDISGKQDKTDETLQTTEKSVVGAINEVDSNLKNHLSEYNGLSQLVMGLEEQVHNHVTNDFPALKNKVDLLEQQGTGGSAGVDISLVVSTTYAELKALRDSKGLSVGTWYRITDYETTVYNNANARSAGHLFDILVLAIDVNQLSEDAKAVHSVRDTEGYFAHANLAAWKLKYSLDNDTAKFVWASDGGEKYTVTLPEIGLVELTPVSTNDTTYEGCPYKFTGAFAGMQLTIYLAHLELQPGEEFIHNVLVIEGMGEMIDNFPVMGVVHENQAPGKGVIWEMEDEYNNLCPYDFKNIQFKRCLISSTQDSPSEEECAFFGKYVGLELEETPKLPEGYYINTEDTKYLYTFSVISADGSVEDNSLGVDLTSAGMGILHLCAENRMRPNINASSFALDLNNNVFVANCNSIEDMMNIIQMGNTFGVMCQGNTFVNMTMENVFGNECWYNTFGNDCRYNSFGNDCRYNSFGNGCDDNSFGNGCDNNSFGNDCWENSFGNGCDDNSFGNSCGGNSFGNYFQNNSFGNNCHSNSFGNNCDSNSFGNECYDNSFGNYCYSNSFGNGCDNNSFGNYCYRNSFGNSCYNNSFGNSCGGNSFGNNCYYNSFGNYFQYNSFGNDCYYNSFGNGCHNNSILDNVKYITVFEGVYYVSIGSASGTVQYAQVLNGTCGSSSSNKLQINFATGKSYTQIAGKNSSGELKIWVPADVVA